MDGTDIVRVCASAVSAVLMMWYRYRVLKRTDRVHELSLGGRDFVNEILTGHPRDCFDVLRMSTSCFMLLANELRRKGLMNDSRYLNVEEQLAIFLFTVGHSERNRVMQNRFQRSGETISRYFNSTLHSILNLAKYYVKQSDGECPPEIASNPLFYPYFKDCVGAIDGMHFPAWVRLEDQARYRNKKGGLSQNVMAVVSFDMCFQYVFAGWEGSASDSKVLQDAVWRRPSNKLVVPNGKYYLVDADYANTRGFLAPYCGVRYHPKEWSMTEAPRTGQELFNLHHSKLRNVVGRAFAALKQRFSILQTAPRYPTKTQAKIVVACCILHNFIRRWNFEDEMFDVATDEVLEEENTDEGAQPGNNYCGPSEEDKDYMTQFREQLAGQMWAAGGDL